MKDPKGSTHRKLKFLFPWELPMVLKELYRLALHYRTYSYTGFELQTVKRILFFQGKFIAKFHSSKYPLRSLI